MAFPWLFYRILALSRKEEKRLIYADICKAFYIPEDESDLCELQIGLKGVTSQAEVATYFFTLGCGSEYMEIINEYNPSTFNKWFYGTTGQNKRVWERFKNGFNEDEYVQLLETNFENQSILKNVAKRLGIKLFEDKKINEHMLAVAIAKQMQEFAKSKKAKQEADNILSDVYSVSEVEADFSDYIEKASKRYNVMKLIGGDEVPLEEFFVCNTIGEVERVFADKKRIKSAFIEEPTMQSIRNILKKRGFDNIRTILIGSGGCGKSLMMQHLFLKAAKEYSESGILPIFLELRHFTQSDSILSYIVDTVREYDENFTEEVANSLLLAGKCQILFDGFDEVDPTDVNSFLAKLTSFVGKYDKTQIIVSSRQSEALKGLRQFPKKLYVWPFEKNQSEKLIDKILNYQGTPGARDVVLDYVNNGFLKKDGVFVSHPLLLTFVTMKYPLFHKFNEDHSLFYKVTYEALLSGHDENKKPYDRVFMSVDNSEQFSTVFKEFCALTYKDGVFELDTRKFEEYFNQLRSYKGFKNSSKMNVKNFKHDVCSTACIMYEKEYDMLYIDPGFQQCLFAEYYYQAGQSEMEELVKSLSKKSLIDFEKFDALDMLHKLSPNKFNFKILLPFLETIFCSKNDIECFRKFMEICFDEVKVVDIDEIAQCLCMDMLGTTMAYYPIVENYPRTILLEYLLREMGEDLDFRFSFISKTVSLVDKEIRKINIPEDVEFTGKVLAQEITQNGNLGLLLDCKPMDQYKYFRTEHLNKRQNAYLTDENGELLCIGNRLTLTSYYLMTEAEKYDALVTNVIENSKETYDFYIRLKTFFKQLRIEFHNSGLN